MTFERAYREVIHLGAENKLRALDLAVGYAGGDNGEDHRDQWLRIE